MNAQLTSLSWNQGRLWSAMFIAGLSAMTVAGQAAADTYNFWLKSAASQPYGGVTKCATGAFTYTKTGVTTEVGEPVSNMTMSISQDCIQTNRPATTIAMTGTLNVVARNINLNGEFQGPNVDGLTGTLSSPIFEQGCARPSNPNLLSGRQLVRWDLVFSSLPGINGAPGTRTFDLTAVVGQCAFGTNTPNFTTTTSLVVVNDGPYHVYNTIVRPAPEPKTLWLLLGGAGALALLRRKRRLA